MWFWLSLGGLGVVGTVAGVALLFWPESEADNVVRENETCQQFASRTGAGTNGSEGGHERGKCALKVCAA